MLSNTQNLHQLINDRKQIKYTNTENKYYNVLDKERQELVNTYKQCNCKIKNNICVGFKKKYIDHFFNYNSEANKEIKTCCTNCAVRNGYLKSYEIDIKFDYISIFNNIYGFLEKGKGCRLPLNKRSLVCLSWKCMAIINNESR